MAGTHEVTKVLTYVFEDEAPLPGIERLDLNDGLYLAPIPAFLLQADNNYHLMDVTPVFSQFFRDHLHESTLNIAFSGRNDLNYEGVHSEEESAKRKMDNYLLSAMIHTPRFLAPYAAFVTIPDQKRICYSSRMKEFGYIGSADQELLTEAEFTRINHLYTRIKDIFSVKATGKLPTALRYYQQAFRSDIDWSVRFLGMMMAMEALFGQGTTEIAHQVSERTAFFLKETPEDREKLYDSMKRHYALRSTIAHGGMPNDGQVKLDASFGHLVHILRDALVRIIEDSATLSLFESGSKEQFNTAMRKLVFRGTIMSGG